MLCPSNSRPTCGLVSSVKGKMESPTAPHDLAKGLEEGRIVPYNGSLEKPEVLSPSTDGGSTLVAAGTASTLLSGRQSRRTCSQLQNSDVLTADLALRKIQRWTLGVKEAIKPQFANKPKIKVRKRELSAHIYSYLKVS